MERGARFMKSSLYAVGIIALLALAAWAMAGCGGGSSDGTGRIQISLVDAPFGADEINVEIASVQVHKAGGSWMTVKTYDPPLPVNLLDYSTGGSSLMLADAPLDAGHYTMVRLMLTSAEIVIGGVPHPVDLQNVEQTGVKCNGEFTVESGELMALILDFNAGRSFVNNPPGSDNYMLHPVMTMSPVNIATVVTGTVTGCPSCSEAVVNVYPQGHAGEASLLIASASVEAGCTFRFAVLRQGIYDFQAQCEVFDPNGGPDGSGAYVTLTGTRTDVVVTAPTTDIGTIEIPPLPPGDGT